MTPQFLALTLGILALATMTSAIFLLINARAVARMFLTRREAGPKAGRALSWHTSDSQVWSALATFTAGSVLTLFTCIAAIG